MRTARRPGMRQEGAPVAGNAENPVFCASRAFAPGVLCFARRREVPESAPSHAPACVAAWRQEKSRARMFRTRLFKSFVSRSDANGCTKKLCASHNTALPGVPLMSRPPDFRRFLPAPDDAEPGTPRRFSACRNVPNVFDRTRQTRFRRNRRVMNCRARD